MWCFFFFFFQAEDGIRDLYVTGVQTCALPIFQVYGSDTVPAGKTMVELHSNFAVQGARDEVNGVLPSIHALHETMEITHGFTPWFETGFYLFSSIQPEHGWEWVGDHIRPRVAVPAEWHWPVGV